MTRLRTTSPDGKTQTIPLGTAPKIIGRDERADIVVDSRAVSLQHCSVAALPGGVRLQDLGSTNGTHVNGVRVTDTVLKNGDQLRVGDLTFLVECETPVGFSTAVRHVEQQFASGKGFHTLLSEIAAESKPGALGATPRPPSTPPPDPRG